MFTIAIAICFLLLPLMVNAQSDQKAAGPPPVQQNLVPEGFFAIKLADALKVGAVKSEAEAETTLTSVGISPKNGWIADYPVTPDIIVELQKSVGTAADSGKLTMNKEDALKALENVSTELGLPVVASAEQSAQDQAAQSYGEYSNPSAINRYYYDEGPPVVTYYAPPPDYYYLYAWVPFPFWCGGFWFPGYFVLNDFDTIVFINKRFVHCSNHFIDPRTHSVGRIDPVTRTIGRNVRSAASPGQAGFHTAQARSGAAAIFNRSLERTRTANINRGAIPGRSAQTGPSTIGRTRSFNRPSSPYNREGAPSRMREFSNRSFSGPSTVGHGSFGSRSFGGFHDGGSFGGSQGGGSFGGFHGGGFGGGFHGGGGRR